MKRITKPFLLIILLMSLGIDMAQAGILGDSIVFIYNGWLPGDSVQYTNTTTKTVIKGNDTTRNFSINSRFLIGLKEILPDGDEIFEYRPISTEHDDLGEVAPLKPLLDKLRGLKNTRLLLRTDSLGELKSVVNIDEVRSTGDSALNLVRVLPEMAGGGSEARALTDGILDSYIQTAYSPENILGNENIFKFYGNIFETGTSSNAVRLPIPMLDNKEIDATVDFECSILEATEEYELVLLSTFVNYNSDQLLDLFMSKFLSDKKDQLSFMTSPDRPYASLTVSEKYLIDAVSGLVYIIDTEKRTVLPGTERIDHTVVEIVEEDPE